LPAIHTLQPLVFETYGTTHSSAIDFLKAVGGRSNSVTGDHGDMSIIWQRISVLLQCYNSTRISKTLVDPDEAQALSFQTFLLTSAFSHLVLYTLGH